MNSIFLKLFFIVVYLKKCFQLKGKSSDKQLLSIDYSLGVYTVISSLIGSSRAVESAYAVILASHACLRTMLATKSTILTREVEYRRSVSNFYERMAFLNYTLISLQNYDGDVNGNVRERMSTLSTCITLFCTFLCCPRTTTTWNNYWFEKFYWYCELGCMQSPLLSSNLVDLVSHRFGIGKSLMLWERTGGEKRQLGSLSNNDGDGYKNVT